MQVREVKDRLNARQRWAVVVMDVLLLTELTCCIYIAQQDMATMTVRFLTMFVPMLIGTYVLARFVIRALRTPEAETPAAETEENDDAQATSSL